MTLIEISAIAALVLAIGNVLFSAFNKFNDIKHLKLGVTAFYKFEKKVIRKLAVIETKLGIEDDKEDE